MVSSTVRAALAKAALVAAASPTAVSKARLLGRSAQTLRRAGLERGHGADHMRQRLPVDRDRFGGILRRLEAVGDDKGDRIADVPHHIFGQDRIDRDLDVHVRQ